MTEPPHEDICPPAPLMPAAWHHDPRGRFAQRYWDGGAWTAYVSTAMEPPRSTRPERRSEMTTPRGTRARLWVGLVTVTVLIAINVAAIAIGDPGPSARQSAATTAALVGARRHRVEVRSAGEDIARRDDAAVGAES